MEDTVKQLREQLNRAEQALEKSERLAIASQYASAIMHEVNNPLEAITNLVYLTKLQKAEPDQVFENMGVIEDQLKVLGKVTSQALTFHREQQTAVEVDLVGVADSALKLLSDKLMRHGVQVKRRFRGPVLATVFVSQILQAVSNLILNAVDAFGDH
jgi:C4-dicarboxylate-specific signal transduction histidine kinase